jgi:uroporphyrinogen decarboxylase
MVAFQCDYRHMLDVLANRRPTRLPIYEHIISPVVMEQILDCGFFELIEGETADQIEFFRQYCRFFQEMTYDTVSYEVTICTTLPDHGAIFGGRPGPIQNRSDFDAYPWSELPDRYWHVAASRFDAMSKSLPLGMKAVGGIGNGVFELSEDLVGFEYLAYMAVDDPELLDDLYSKIGDLLVEIWSVFLDRYGDDFAVCRFGDDLGFKTSTLVSPNMIRQFILPHYKRVIDLVKSARKPFLWHSCGNIFAIMDDVIALGIDAKHSNEDAIAPFDEWISLYGDRIGLLGGIDVGLLCTEDPGEITKTVLENGKRFRVNAQGYALGSGNSIPDYVPVDGYLALVEAANQIRESEIV